MNVRIHILFMFKTYFWSLINLNNIKMKKFSWFLLLVFMAFACQLQNEEVAVSSDASAATIADYSATGTTNDGLTFTFEVDVIGVGTAQNKVPGISHINFNFLDCDGNALNLNNVVSFTLNGEDVFEFLESGDGSDCASVSTENTIKINSEEESPIGSTNVIVIKLDTQSSGGTVYIKAGAQASGGGCFGAYNFEGNCDDEPCYEYQGETAWTAGTRFVQRGNWATYTAYDGHAKTVNIFAGQTHWAGSADFSAPVDGKVTIKITLNEGWSLQEGDNSVKIQPYSSTPPASNPSPGRFQYKGTSLEIEVDEAAFYGVHLDVMTKREVPCE
jgi:hypothetical protein